MSKKKKTGTTKKIRPETPSVQVTAPLGRIHEHGHAIKEYVAGKYHEYRRDIDPEKLQSARKTIKKLLHTGSIYLLGIGLCATMLAGIEYWLDGKVFMNTKAFGLEIGLQTQNQIRTKLTEAIGKYFSTPINLSFEGKKISITPKELGINLYTESTLRSLPIYRFSDTNPSVILHTVFSDTIIAPEFTIDRSRIISLLEQKFGIADRRAKNARIVMKDKAPAIEPEKPGIVIDDDKLIESLIEHVKTLSDEEIHIKTTAEQPWITAQSLSLEKDRLAGLINQTVTLFSGKIKVKYSLQEHLDHLDYLPENRLTFRGTNYSLPISLNSENVSVPADGAIELHSALSISINTQKLDSLYRDNLLKDLEIPTSGVKIYTNQEGKILIEGKGEDGRTVPIERLAAAIELAANSKLSQVKIPVLIEKAPVSISQDLKNQGIRELIGTGYTTFYGSHTNRIFNINAGIKKFNGVIIKPGEEFSFNTTLGKVDAKNGFKPEKVIKNNKVEIEYGGGICQVSTTAYRAALFAGFPITARKPHTWKLNYYSQVLGDGLDATIYIGGSDLKFINDSPGAVVIQSYTDGMAAYFKFYGTHDGRTVSLDGPHGGGMSFTWYRDMVKNGQPVHETISSRYIPMPVDPPPVPPANS